MYDYLFGKVISISDSYIILEVNNIGYKVYINNNADQVAKSRYINGIALQEDAHAFYSPEAPEIKPENYSPVVHKGHDHIMCKEFNQLPHR